jgi:hypothetical protein
VQQCPADDQAELCIAYRGAGEAWGKFSASAEHKCSDVVESVALNASANPSWGRVWCVCDGVLVFDNACR